MCPVGLERGAEHVNSTAQTNFTGNKSKRKKKSLEIETWKDGMKQFADKAPFPV